MFDLIMMVCLAASGTDCKEFKLPDKEYTDAVSCIRESQGEAATWQSANTKYTIIGTRCAKDAKVPEAPKS